MSSGRRKLKVAIILSSIFLAGIICGIVGTGLFVRNQVSKAMNGGPDYQRTVLMRRLVRELRLTDEQKAVLEPIVAEGQESVIALRKKHFPELIAVIEETSGKMEQHLDDKQKDELTKMVHRFREVADPEKR
jgi:hypothetical protein